MSDIKVVSKSKCGKRAQIITKQGTKHVRLVKPGVFADKQRKQYHIGD